MDFKSQAIELVKQMSTKQKISIFSSCGLSLMNDMNELGIPSAHIAEGMSKLHLSEKAEHLEIPGQVSSIFYPLENTLAASFDIALMGEIGKCMGEECLEHDIDVLIGPYINVKRNPLCGKGERYLSEDPYLNGKMGASFVNGLQEIGVAACIPALGINCRETKKAITNYVIDEKTLDDIYLRPFETVIKEANPIAFMTASGKMNGVDCTKNKDFLTTVVRNQWNYEGLLASAPGCMSDTIESFKAGMDLELPGKGKETEKDFLQAFKDHELSEEELDKMAIRRITNILRLKETRSRNLAILKGNSDISKNKEDKEYVFDRSAHRRLAWTAAQESAILLKNNGILPLADKKNVAVIGALAKYPRFGKESVKEEEMIVASPLQVFEEYGYRFGYAAGYSLDSDEVDEELTKEACCVAEGREIVLFFMGNPKNKYQDKKHLLLPKNQMILLDAVLQKNRNVIVIVENDGIFRLPQIQKVSALLCMGIAGEQCGRAIVNILSGQANPCGRLPETIPNSAKDIPSFHYSNENDEEVEYREGIFTGYRYYDTAKKNVQFPFGFGLSYTQFEYGNLEIDQTSCEFRTDSENAIHLDLPITNTGEYDGKEVVQLYIKDTDASMFHPEKELRGVAKIFVPKKETRMASFELTKEDFMTYSMLRKKRIVKSGTYEICIGSNSRNILKSVTVSISFHDTEATLKDSTELALLKESLPTYFKLPQADFQISDEEYWKLIGEHVVCSNQERIITPDSSLREIQLTFWGNIVIRKLFRKLEKKDRIGLFPSVRRSEVELMDLPIYQVCILYCGLSRNTALGYIDICNHRFLRGIRKLI